MTTARHLIDTDEGGDEPYLDRVAGIALRVAVRQGTDPSRPPLVLLNGIGARLELLDGFVEHVDARITVIRFDVPGVVQERWGHPFPAALLIGMAIGQNRGILSRLFTGQ